MGQRIDPEISSVDYHEARSVTDVLALAFSEDPFVRWLFPSASGFQRWFSEFVLRYSGESFENNTADRTADETGAALWLEPGIRPDLTRVGDLFESTVSEAKRDELWRISEALMDATPVEPYWHLTFIGVDPAFQRAGTGTALLEHGLARCDVADRVAYLETSNPRNLSLFTRHGFQLIDVIQTGSGPSLYAMAREPGGDLR